MVAKVEYPWTEGPIDLKRGDLVIVHYLTFFDGSGKPQPPHDINGQNLYDVKPENVFAIVKDGDLQPVGGYIMGVPVYREKLKSSFLVIPDAFNKEEVQNEAIITAIPKGMDTKLKTGDHVFMLRWSNYKLDYQGKQFLRFRQSEVIGTFDYEN